MTDTIFERPYNIDRNTPPQSQTTQNIEYVFKQYFKLHAARELHYAIKVREL